MHRVHVIHITQIFLDIKQAVWEDFLCTNMYLKCILLNVSMLVIVQEVVRYVTSY